MALEIRRKRNGAADVEEEIVWSERRRLKGGKAGGSVHVKVEPRGLSQERVILVYEVSKALVLQPWAESEDASPMAAHFVGRSCIVALVACGSRPGPPTIVGVSSKSTMQGLAPR